MFPTKNLFPEAVAFRLPREPRVFLFDVLTSGAIGDATYAATETPKARAPFEAARAVGGTLYPIGSAPTSKTDWAIQYGPLYPVLRALRQIFDPAGILTTGRCHFRARALARPRPISKSCPGRRLAPRRLACLGRPSPQEDEPKLWGRASARCHDFIPRPGCTSRTPLRFETTS